MTSHTSKLRIYALIASMLIVIGVAVAGYYFINDELSDNTNITARVSTEVANDDMVEIIVNTLSSDIVRLLTAAKQPEVPANWKGFADHPEFVSFDNRARALALNTRILKLKIYDESGATIYSTDVTQLGADYSKREEFVHALRGQSTSSIIQRDFFRSFTQDIKDATLVASYHPLRSADGTIIGVAEVYANRTREFKAFSQSLRIHSVATALGISVATILILSMLAYFALVSPSKDD